MAATVWKGYLTFGLITIPIRLFSAARSERVSFNQLHSVCHSRLKQPLFCPVCNRNVERTEIVKGYEQEKGQYLLFDEGELEKIAPPSASSMEILEFVKQDEVDPLYYDASYFVTPEDAGQKAYNLLTKAMEDSGYAAVAKLSMHQREYIVVVRPRAHGLTLHTMFFSSEIRQVSEYGRPSTQEVKPQELKLAEQLIASLAGKFEPEKYKDEYQSRVKDLIAAKAQGQTLEVAPQARLAPVIDLMEALKKSLSERGAAPKRPPERVAATEDRKRRKRSASG